MATYNLITKEPKMGWGVSGMLLTDKELAAYQRENCERLDTIKVSVTRKDVYWFFGGRYLSEENNDYIRHISMDKHEAIKRIKACMQYNLILVVENTEARKGWFWLTKKDLAEYKEYEVITYRDFESGTKGIVYPIVRENAYFLRVKIEGGFAFVKIP